MKTEIRGTEKGQVSYPVRGLQLFGLCAFAFSQPLFDILSHHADFFAARQSPPIEIILYVVISLCVPPVVLFAVELGSGAVSNSLQRVTRIFFSSLLGTLILLTLVNRVPVLHGYTTIIVASLGGLLLGVSMDRIATVRSFVSVLSVGTILFPIYFLIYTPVSRFLITQDPSVTRVTTSRDTPVVFVIFDALSLAALLDAQGQIDAERYPNFLRLTGNATWFRNATTVATDTEAAVPAILTGRYHRKGLKAIHHDHPDNLFTLLGGSFELDVTEEATYLCPDALRGYKVSEPLLERLQTLFTDLYYVYLHIVLPTDLAVHVPQISGQWGDFGRASATWGVEKGFSSDETRGENGQPGAGSESAPTAKRQTPLNDRGDAFSQFVSRLDGEKRRVLHYFHVNAPHPPFRFLPSGRAYDPGKRIGIDKTWGKTGAIWEGVPEVIDHFYTRYLLQVEFVDGLLGTLIDALESTGLYDQALIIITSDHGHSFRLGGEIRSPNQDNFAEAIMVPLFVKFPDQKIGRTVTQNVQSIDILPTIADVLGISVPWPVDGQSLLRENIEFDGGNQIFYYGKAHNFDASLEFTREAERRAYLRKAEVLKPILVTVRRYGDTGVMDLLNQPVAHLPVSPGSLCALLDKESILNHVDPDRDPLPLHLTGKIDGPEVGQRKPLLAFGFNGIIARVVQSFRVHDTLFFSVLLPERLLRRGDNRLEIFELHPTGVGSEVTLNRVELCGRQQQLASNE